MVGLTLAAAWGGATAEPYVAVRAGLSCASCHVNATGGGERTAYGAGYGARTLPWRTPGERAFDGQIHDQVRIGADLRAGYLGTIRAGGAPYLGEYRTDEANLSVDVAVLRDRLHLYADEQVAPGQASSREAFAAWRFATAGAWVKAGRFFVPFGIRLQDDDAATRRPMGFSFDGSDTGIEAGLDSGTWYSALAFTNGTGGGPETDNGKQVSWTGSFVRPRWRAGLSAMENRLPGSAGRKVAGPHAAAKLGPVVLLGEVLWAKDRDGVDPAVRSAAAHVEADWIPIRGLTLRAWAGGFDPDRSMGGDRRDQAGLAADWTALPGLQVRAIVRLRDGPADVPGARDDQAEIQVHVYF